VLQRCYRGVIEVLQKCYRGVTEVLQRCYRGVAEVLHIVNKVAVSAKGAYYFLPSKLLLTISCVIKLLCDLQNVV